MKKGIFFLMFVFAMSLIYGQTQIYVLDFESSGGYTSSISECTDSGGDYFIRTNGANINASLTGKQGDYFFAAQDIDASTCPAASGAYASLTIEDINISGYTNLEVRIYIAEDDDGAAQDWDGEDYFHLGGEIDVNGSQNLIWVEGLNATNTEPQIDTNFDGTGDGTAITDEFVQFTKTISGTGSLLDLLLEFDLNSGDEDIAIDHIEIYGIATTPIVGFANATSTVTEGNSGTTTHNVSVTMNIAPSSDADVDVISSGNTATEGTDYVGISPTLTFPAAGSYPMTQMVPITINGDLDVESNEAFDLILAMASGSEALATEGTDTHEVTITNDDILPTVDFVLGTSSVTEGNSGTTTHNVSVTMDVAPSSDADVDVVSSENTATEGDDYVAVSTTLTFLAAGAYPMTQMVPVTINGDLDVESNEAFDLILGMASGSESLAAEGTDTHEVTITNDDILPTVSFVLGTSSVTEGDSGTSTHNVSVRMDVAPSSDADVDIESLENTATEGDDYDGVSTTVTFPTAGSYPMTQMVAITINGDTDVESNETFDLILAMAPGSESLADEGTDTHEVTIINDDIPPSCLEEDFVDFSNWTNFGTATDNVSSHYGASGPCRALGSGDALVSPFLDNPQVLNFYQDASSGGNGNTATVEYKIGAGAWTSLYSFTVSTSGGNESVDLTNVGGVDLSAQSSVAFRFNSSFSTWYLDDVSVLGTACVLPINLLTFTATATENQTLVKWTTSAELNNDYMAVEHSTNGRDFTEIGRVKGAGTTEQAQNYTFTDTKPANGVNFYRLRQVDFDGHTTYHKVVSVMMYGKEGEIRLAPTEVQSQVMLYLPEAIDQSAEIRIYDMSGRLWQSSTLEAGNSQKAFDLAHLAVGQYVLQVVGTQTVSTVRFNKL